MAQVRVWNDNRFEYREQFRDGTVVIPPKKYILMEEGEAKLFQRAFAPIQTDGDGNPIEQGFKMIRLERIESESVKTPDVVENQCHACGYEASSTKDLDEHVSASHKDILVRDEAAEQEIRRKKKAG